MVGLTHAQTLTHTHTHTMNDDRLKVTKKRRDPTDPNEGWRRRVWSYAGSRLSAGWEVPHHEAETCLSQNTEEEFKHTHTFWP